MSIIHPIYMNTYVGVAGPGNVLEAFQGGVNNKQVTGNIQMAGGMDLMTKMHFVFDGNVYIACGIPSCSGNQGFLTMNPNTGKFHQQSAESIVNSLLIPLKDRILFARPGYYGSGTTPRINTSWGSMSTPFTSPWDHVIRGSEVFLLDSVGQVFIYTYPFTGGPARIILAGASHRIFEFRGEIYVLRFTTTTSFLYRYTGGSFVLVGSGFTLTDAANITTPGSTRVAVFKFNNKMFFAITYNTGVRPKVRCFELDTALGTVIERDYCPAAWKANSTDNTQKIFEVIGHTGATEQIFLVRVGGSAIGTWEIAEFSESTWPIQTSGADIIYPPCGIVYSPLGHGAHIKSAIDSIPSSYVDMSIEVSDLFTNAPVSIDPRFRQLDAVADNPPYTQCSEMSGVGSEGKIGLSTKPSGVALLPDLSDDFEDSIINLDKWEIVNESFEPGIIDFGFGYGTSFICRYDIAEVGGKICFGGTSPVPTPTVRTGIGLKSRWWLEGDITIDVILANLAALVQDANRYKCIYLILRENVNVGYGFRIWKNVTPLNKCRGINFRLNTSPLETADSTVSLLDGMKMRISRTALGAVSIIADQGGTNENITPASGILMPGPVELIIGAICIDGNNWASATPGPGYASIEFSGAGSVGKFDGGKAHKFCWDHTTDLGVGITKGIPLFVDTNP